MSESKRAKLNNFKGVPFVCKDERNAFFVCCKNICIVLK